MNLRESIIHEALKLFSLNGYLSTGVNDIITAAHTSKGGFYNHFSSKEDLFFAVFEWFKMRTEDAARVNIAVLGGSAAKRLEALGSSGKLFIMLSSGGITSIKTAAEFPVRIIESGPTAAVIAGQSSMPPRME